MNLTMTRDAAPVRPSVGLLERSLRFASMGGCVSLRIATPPGTEIAAECDLEMVARRIERWAERITRFAEGSELVALNRERAQPSTSVGPSLGALLARSRQLSEATGGLVDVTLLDARLTAEQGGSTQLTDTDWRLLPSGRRWRVLRQSALAFDLDGVGKGWIADRALGLLRRYPCAMVDADGDVAFRAEGGCDWGIAIADPRMGDGDLGVLAPPPGRGGATFGIATSGTSVHRWQVGTGWAHHLIDPRSGRPSDSDVVQATVVADGALMAEALAKSVVIAGADAGLRLLARARAQAAVVLLSSGDVIAPAGAEAWLA
ncbi:MAG TPA: FAD:protein FMN transferase [Anaerolineae bacterium]|nr:FAD:protein FMN transferase [Anaerolineae bacterium]